MQSPGEQTPQQGGANSPLPANNDVAHTTGCAGKLVVTPAEDPHICSRCAQVHTTCCFVTPGNEEHCFPLSESEWKRIIEYCDNTGGFAEQRNSPSFLDTMKRLFPHDSTALAREFPAHGTHRTLASRENGVCYFLTEAGCRLPRDVRPWYCRLYPFWIRSGMLTMFTSTDCLVCRESINIPEALAFVDMSQKEVRRIFGQLRIAWGLDPEDDQL